MPTVTDLEPTGTLSFQQALDLAEVLARTALPTVLHERISCAVALVKTGAVLETDDSHVWTVASASTPGKEYSINGHGCSCEDAHYKAPKGMCKHVLSVMLARKTLRLMQSPPPVVAEAPAAVPPATPSQSAPSAEPLQGMPTPPQHHEAPASVNVPIMLEGRQVQLTLRDTVETRLLQRLAAVLQQYPAPAPPVRPQGQPATQGQDKGWCAKHGVQMKQTTKDGRSWWSHRHEGQWCKGR
jgi:hypothetical protein